MKEFAESAITDGQLHSKLSTRAPISRQGVKPICSQCRGIKVLSSNIMQNSQLAGVYNAVLKALFPESFPHIHKGPPAFLQLRGEIRKKMQHSILIL